MKKEITIGTRGSMLALTQTNLIKKELEIKFPEIQFTTKIIKTIGDISVDKAFSELPQKKVFVKEIEEELLNNQIDIAVHSMKDMALTDTEGLVTAAITKREDAGDVLLSKYESLEKVPIGACIGTGSVRRKRQLEILRPDLKIMDIRGNIDTRINKLKNKEYDGIILASAGLKRAGIEYENTYFFSNDEMISAPGQGALGIQCRSDDEYIKKILLTLNCEKTNAEVWIEREFSKYFDGGCKMPIGAFAKIIENEIVFKFFIEKNGKIVKETLRSNEKEFQQMLKTSLLYVSEKLEK